MTVLKIRDCASESNPGTNKQKTILLTVLRSCWPSSIGCCSPLMLGAREKIISQMPDLDRRILAMALLTHCRSFKYVRAVAADGSMRHDLEGKPVELVSEYHRYVARRWILKRAKRK